MPVKLLRLVPRPPQSPQSPWQHSLTPPLCTATPRPIRPTGSRHQSTSLMPTRSSVCTGTLTISQTAMPASLSLPRTLPALTQEGILLFQDPVWIQQPLLRTAPLQPRHSWHPRLSHSLRRTILNQCPRRQTTLSINMMRRQFRPHQHCLRAVCQTRINSPHRRVTSNRKSCD